MRKTHCPHGHRYTPDNVYTDKRNHHHCRACTRVRKKKWYQTKDKARRTARYAAARRAYRPPTMRPPRYGAGFGHWLSGFVDGEGCFLASITATSVAVGLTVKLRADDRPILESIRDTLGIGTVYDRPPSPTCKLKASPAAQWMARSSRDLYRVALPQFDTYPLRSKKARDYTIWRKIVVLAAGQKRGGGNLREKIGDKVAPLIRRLRSGRRFVAPA